MLRTKTLCKTVFAISLLALIVLGLNLHLQSSMDHPTIGVEGISQVRQPIDYVEDTSPVPPKQLSVLKVISKELTEEDAVKIAHLFDVEGEVRMFANGWSIKEGSKEVTVEKIGIVSVFGGVEMSEMHLPEEFLSKEDYVALAKNFVEGVLKPNNLLPEKHIQFKIEVVADRTIIAHKDGSEEEYWNNVHVNFIPTVNGAEILSPSSKIRVYFNTQGQITGFLTFFWGVEPIKTCDIISQEEAVGKLKEKFSGGLVEIESIDLVYFSLDREPAELVPSYFIIGKCINPETGTWAGFGEAIAAIKS